MTRNNISLEIQSTKLIILVDEIISVKEVFSVCSKRLTYKPLWVLAKIIKQVTRKHI